MLGSITPLGERGRDRVWGRTVLALIVGGALGGAALGATAGLVGSVLLQVVHVSDGARLAALGVVLAVTCAMDVAGTVPTSHRQVNEDWLTLYRDWIYGLGFGFQLGAGVVTIVTTAAIFALIAAAAATGTMVAGATVGAAFGALRASTVLFSLRVNEPANLADLQDVLERWERPAKVATPIVLAALGVAALLVGAAT
jgi:hypothetical protein